MHGGCDGVGVGDGSDGGGSVGGGGEGGGDGGGGDTGRDAVLTAGQVSSCVPQRYVVRALTPLTAL